MQKEFWLERWEKAQIGFHDNAVNSHLNKFWGALRLSPGPQVFVPLCGKSVDMRWLQEQGCSVLGVELSDIAARDFFRENAYQAQLEALPAFQKYSAQDISILAGDFFDLTPQELGKVAAVYDRAAMVALPADMRARYVQHLRHILPSGTQILLVTFDYPQQEMAGPPFALPAAEVAALYQPFADMVLLETVDVLEQNLRFKQRGLTRLQESVYLLTLR